MLRHRLNPHRFSVFGFMLSTAALARMDVLYHFNADQCHATHVLKRAIEMFTTPLYGGLGRKLLFF